MLDIKADVAVRFCFLVVTSCKVLVVFAVIPFVIVQLSGGQGLIGAGLECDLIPPKGFAALQIGVVSLPNDI
ncbi:hypothetical protein, partial [Bacteroides heparinolyticus]|uniref:hypothetical protein n=1 Tax=Prevotella heparinolytica TaxID=28113 RepID=UPI00359F935D